MVRTKVRARRVLVSLSDPCISSDPEYISYSPNSFFWGKTAKNSSTSNPVITQLTVRNPPTGGVLSTPDDFLIDTEYYFVRKSLSVDQKWYYRSLRYSYENRHPHGKLGRFSKVAFSDMTMGNPPFSLKDRFAQLSHDEQDKVVRAAFHLDSEV